MFCNWLAQRLLKDLRCLTIKYTLDRISTYQDIREKKMEWEEATDLLMIVNKTHLGEGYEGEISFCILNFSEKITCIKLHVRLSSHVNI